MRLCIWAVLPLLVVTGVSCNRDPHVVKQKYLANGNRYFDSGRYKEASIMYRRAVQKDPRYSEGYYRLGLTDVRTQRWREAAHNLQRAIDTDEHFANPEARVQLADVYLAFFVANPEKNAELREEIEAISAELLKRDPKSVHGLRLKGAMLLLAERKPGEAVAVLREANETSPGQPEIVLPLAQSLISESQSAEGEKLLSALIEKDKTVGRAYDLLYADYMRAKRHADAENILKLKVANNPGQTEYVLQLALHYRLTNRAPEMDAALNALASRNEFPDGRLRAGNFYFLLRDFDSALRHFEAGAREDSARRATYRKEIARVLIAQERLPEAAKILEEVRKEFPADEQARAMRASLLLGSGDPDHVRTALAELQQAVSQMPDSAATRFNFGRALVAAGQRDQARVQFLEASRLAPNYVAPKLALAQLELLRGQYGPALQHAREVLKLDSRNLAARLISTSALTGVGNRAQARADLLDTLKAHPDSRDAAMQLAALDLTEKRFAQAQQTFRRLHQRDPGDVRALMGLSEAYAAQGNDARAMELLRDELARQPERHQIRLALANLAYRSGKFDLALEHYQALIGSNPAAGEFYMGQGAVHRQKRDFTAALESFEEARRLRPDDAGAHLQLALTYEATGQREQARSFYEEVLRLQPDNPIALNNLAYLIAETGGDLNRALAMAQRARQRMPNNADIADTLGWIYLKKNLNDSAVQIFRELVSKEPNRSTFRYHLGLALFQKGNRVEARNELLRALQKNPAKEEEEKIRALIGAIG